MQDRISQDRGNLLHRTAGPYIRVISRRIAPFVARACKRAVFEFAIDLDFEIGLGGSERRITRHPPCADER